MRLWRSLSQLSIVENGTMSLRLKYISKSKPLQHPNTEGALFIQQQLKNNLSDELTGGNNNSPVLIGDEDAFIEGIGDDSIHLRCHSI